MRGSSRVFVVRASCVISICLFWFSSTTPLSSLCSPSSLLSSCPSSCPSTSCSRMWWTNSLCTLADEDLGTLAEYDPLTYCKTMYCYRKDLPSTSTRGNASEWNSFYKEWINSRRNKSQKRKTSCVHHDSESHGWWIWYGGNSTWSDDTKDRAIQEGRQAVWRKLHAIVKKQGSRHNKNLETPSK